MRITAPTTDSSSGLVPEAGCISRPPAPDGWRPPDCRPGPSHRSSRRAWGETGFVGGRAGTHPRGRSELVKGGDGDGSAMLGLQGGKVVEGEDLFAQGEGDPAEADLQSLDDRLTGPDQGTFRSGSRGAPYRWQTPPAATTGSGRPKERWSPPNSRAGERSGNGSRTTGLVDPDHAAVATCFAVGRPG
jgi:hypothetical protein